MLDPTYLQDHPNPYVLYPVTYPITHPKNAVAASIIAAVSTAVGGGSGAYLMHALRCASGTSP